MGGLLFGLLVGFGFLLQNNGMHKLYEQRPFSLFVVTAVGDILTMSAIGVILALGNRRFSNMAKAPKKSGVKVTKKVTKRLSRHQI